MIVVSDASPLIALSAIGQLDLLSVLYSEVAIPPAVWQEVVVEGHGLPGAAEVSTSPWIRVIAVQDAEAVEELLGPLNIGEAEAIVLALQIHADLLLVDEDRARTIARQFKLNVVGTIGVLIEAKRKGLLQQIRPSLDALRSVGGFWISDALYREVLLDEGELGP